MSETNYTIELSDGTIKETAEIPTPEPVETPKQEPVETPKPEPVETPKPEPAPSNNADYAALTLQDALKIPSFKRELDRYVTKATQTAIATRKEKEERMRNKELTTAQRLAGLDGEDLREAALALIAEEQRQVERKEEQVQLRSYVSSTLSEKAMPDSLIDVFDFVDDTQETIDRKISALTEYHNTLTKEFEKRMADAESEWSKQLPPEQHGTAAENSALEKKLSKYTPKRR